MYDVLLVNTTSSIGHGEISVRHAWMRGRSDVIYHKRYVIQYVTHYRPLRIRKLSKRDTAEAELEFHVNVMDQNKKNEGVALLATIVA